MTPPRPPAEPGRSPALDQTPEPDAVREPRAVPPGRTATLPGIPSVPLAPSLPAELAATKPAPRDPLRKQTWRVPTPPSALAQARRSDPPPPESAPPETDAPAGQADALAKLQRQLAEAQAQIDLLRRPAFPPPVSERPRLPAPPAPPATGSLPPTGWSDPRLIKAVIGLVGAMAAAGTPLSIWLTAKATAAETAQRRQAEVAKDATATASSAKAESRDVAKELDALRARLAARDAYHRAILRRLGVEYPSREGEPAEPVLQTQTPQRKPGSVTPQPVLVVVTPPP